MMAEQIAMADLISGGRVLSGFVRGVGVETWWANTNPVHNRERFEECHDLIIKCWTTPGPFRWEGRHYHFRHVNPWCLPLQKPHPPIWVPGTASPETALWAGPQGLHLRAVPGLVRGGARAVRLLPPGRGRGRPRGHAGQARLPDLRRDRRHEGQGARGRPPLRVAHGADAPRRPSSTSRPSGMRSRAASQFALKARSVTLAKMTYEELVDELLHRGRHARRGGGAVRARPAASWASATCSWRPRSRGWTTRRPCARSS